MNTTQLTLPSEKLAYWLENDPDHEILFQPVDGEMKSFTWRQVDDEARRLLTFLHSQGIGQGDKVAMLSKNTAHWIIADIALMLGGIVSVPIYPTANADTISFVLEHSESKAIILGKLDKWEAQAAGVNEGVIKIATPYPTIPADFEWQDIQANNEPATETAAVAADELMTILYTSGSTGNPKGAMHTYASFTNAGKNIGNRFAVERGDRLFSYLPLSHCTERAYVESTLLSFNYEVYFSDRLDTFAADMLKARPTVFGSVPRLWTQFQKTILSSLPNKKLKRLLRIPIVSGMVKKKIKKQMGLEHSRIFLSGSAPLSEKVLQWYRDIDIDIAEGWGMTETFACGTQFTPGTEVRFGTVCQAVENVDIRIADDEEILVKTESNMLGYFKDEEKTKETLSEEGYVHTGDLGVIKDGYLSIVGRKKDIFKTEKGKYVAPIPIESDFGDNEYIEQMCLMGTQLVQPVLVVNLSAHAGELSNEEMESSLLDTMNQVNQKLEAHAKVGAIIVARQAWTTDSGELTPTLKVKRNVVEKTFLPIAQTVKRGTVLWH